MGGGVGGILIFGQEFETTLAAAQAGAGWALTRIYSDLAPPVTGYLRLRGAGEPDDVASEVFLGVFRNLDFFDGGEEQFRSWVFTIAHRRLLDERRRIGRAPRPEPLPDVLPAVLGGDVEVEALAAFGEDWVREVLAGLSRDQRAVLLLRVVADLSVEEVARIVGKRPGAVRALQHRGVETLRRQLERARLSHHELQRTGT